MDFLRERGLLLREDRFEVLAQCIGEVFRRILPRLAGVHADLQLERDIEVIAEVIVGDLLVHRGFLCAGIDHPLLAEGNVHLQGIGQGRAERSREGGVALLPLLTRLGADVDAILRGDLVGILRHLLHRVGPGASVRGIDLQLTASHTRDGVGPGIAVLLFAFCPLNFVVCALFELLRRDRIALTGLRRGAAGDDDLKLISILRAQAEGIVKVGPDLFARKPKGGVVAVALVEEGGVDRIPPVFRLQWLAVLVLVFRGGEVRNLVPYVLIRFQCLGIHILRFGPSVVALEESFLDLDDGVGVGRTVGGVEGQILEGEDGGDDAHFARVLRCVFHLGARPGLRSDVLAGGAGIAGLLCAGVIDIGAVEVKLHGGVDNLLAFLPHGKLEMFFHLQEAALRVVGVLRDIGPLLHRAVEHGFKGEFAIHGLFRPLDRALLQHIAKAHAILVPVLGQELWLFAGGRCEDRAVLVNGSDIFA